MSYNWPSKVTSAMVLSELVSDQTPKELATPVAPCGTTSPLVRYKVLKKAVTALVACDCREFLGRFHLAFSFLCPKHLASNFSQPRVDLKWVVRMRPGNMVCARMIRQTALRSRSMRRKIPRDGRKAENVSKTGLGGNMESDGLIDDHGFVTQGSIRQLWR